ncbi:MAG: hypothetical protein RIT02_542 [Planctomycetota bacterium]
MPAFVHYSVPSSRGEPGREVPSCVASTSPPQPRCESPLPVSFTDWRWVAPPTLGGPTATPPDSPWVAPHRHHGWPRTGILFSRPTGLGWSRQSWVAPSRSPRPSHDRLPPRVPLRPIGVGWHHRSALGGPTGCPRIALAVPVLHWTGQCSVGRPGRIPNRGGNLLLRFCSPTGIGWPHWLCTSSVPRIAVGTAVPGCAAGPPSEPRRKSPPSVLFTDWRWVAPPERHQIRHGWPRTGIPFSRPTGLGWSRESWVAPLRCPRPSHDRLPPRVPPRPIGVWWHHRSATMGGPTPWVAPHRHPHCPLPTAH